ncbi:13214_t:CDS:10, partial [Entrophospora sp. SA101]
CTPKFVVSTSIFIGLPPPPDRLLSNSKLSILSCSLGEGPFSATSTTTRCCLLSILELLITSSLLDDNIVVSVFENSCGQFIPETVHWFVKSSPKLEKIVFNGTPSITNSFVYQFATEQQNASYDSDSVGDAHQKCTIEKENIKKLAQFQQKMPLSFPNTLKIPEDKLDALSSELVTPNSNINFYHCMSPPQSMTANEFQSEYFQNIPDTKSSFSTTSVSSSSNHSQLQDNHFSEKTPINGRKDFNSMEHQQEKGRNGSSAVQYSTSTIEIDIDNNIEKMPPIKLPQIKPQSRNFVEKSSLQQENKVYNEKITFVKPLVGQTQAIINDYDYDDKTVGKQVKNGTQPKSTSGYVSSWNNPCGSEGDNDLGGWADFGNYNENNNNNNTSDDDTLLVDFQQITHTLPTQPKNPQIILENYKTSPKNDDGDVKEWFRSDENTNIPNNNLEYTPIITPMANNNCKLSDNFVLEKRKEKNNDRYQADNSPSPPSPLSSQNVIDSIYISENVNQDQSDSVDLGAWGSLLINKISTWDSHVKRASGVKSKVSELELDQIFETVKTSETTPDPVEESTKPLYFEKKQVRVVNNELDDHEGWGSPPPNDISWSDPRQGICIEMIEEQNQTVFWARINGAWHNVTEEAKAPQKKEEIKSSDADDHNINGNRSGRQGVEEEDDDSASAGPEEHYTRNYQWKAQDEWNKYNVKTVEVVHGKDYITKKKPTLQISDTSGSESDPEDSTLSVPVSQHLDDHIIPVKTNVTSVSDNDDIWNLYDNVKKPEKEKKHLSERQVIQKIEDNFLIDLDSSKLDGDNKENDSSNNNNLKLGRLINEDIFNLFSSIKPSPPITKSIIERGNFMTGQKNVIINGDINSGGDNLLLDNNKNEIAPLISFEETDENIQDQKVIPLLENNVSYQNNTETTILSSSKEDVIRSSSIDKRQQRVVVEVAEKGPSPSEQLRMDNLELESKRSGGGGKPIKIDVETTNFGVQTCYISQGDDDVDKIAREFCDKWEMEKYTTSII